MSIKTRRAIRRSKKITRDAARQMRRVAREVQSIKRRELALTELPAGRVARLGYRADQVGNIVATVAQIAQAAVVIQECVRTLRKTPPSESGIS